MDSLLHVLNDMTPLGVIALLAYIVYLQVKNKQNVAHLGSNHLSGLPDMAASLARMEALLQSINDTVIYLRARSNSK